MPTMKRVAATFGALALLCALTACGQTDDTSAQDKYNLCVSTIQQTNGNDHDGAVRSCSDLKP